MMENDNEKMNFKINPDEFEIKLNEELYDSEGEKPIDQAQSLRMNINRNDENTNAPVEQIQKEAQEEAGPNLKVEVTKSGGEININTKNIEKTAQCCCVSKKSSRMIIFGAVAATIGVLMLYSCNKRR